MTKEETRNVLLTDDDFVLAEARKILYLYTLKHTIRYGQSRDEEDYTESVAEHIFGMHILLDYFLPLEFVADELNKTRLAELITWHDVGEIETGDIPNVRKTEADRIAERELLPTIIQKSPEHIRDHISTVVTEYEEQITPESKFVKAIDKIEPLIHSLHPLGKSTQTQLKLTTTSSVKAKEAYIAQYKTIERFSEVLHKYMDTEGYFYTEVTE